MNNEPSHRIMKSKLLITLVALVAMLALPACDTLLSNIKNTDPAKAAALLKPAALSGGKELTKYVIKNADSAAKKQDRASIMRASALAIRALAANPLNAPTEQEVQRSILELDPDNKHADFLPAVALGLASSYGAFASSFPSEVKLALEVLEQLAIGVEQGLQNAGYAYLPQDLWHMHPAAGICEGTLELLLHFNVCGTSRQAEFS